MTAQDGLDAPETLQWRGHTFAIADVRYDESPYPTGSHWHLTLVEQVGEQLCAECGGRGGRLISNDPDPGMSQSTCRGCWGRGVAEVEPLEPEPHERAAQGAGE